MIVLKKTVFCCFWWFFFVPCVSFSGIWVQVRGLCLLSQPSDTLYFFMICSLSAQCVRHFAPISSNLGSGPKKLTLVFFWNFFFRKKKFFLSFKWRIKISSKTLFINKTSFFLLPDWVFQIKKLFFAVFWWFFLYPCVRFSGIWVQVRGLCLLSQPSDTHYFFLICTLSAQCVRHFAPISSNLGFRPTKLTLVIFWNFKKKFSLVLNDRSKYPPRHCLLMRPALFYFLI